MKFGKEFSTHLEETLPEWRDKFLCYKPLKKFLKNFPTTADPLFPHPNQLRSINGDAAPVNGGDRPEGNVRTVMDLQEWFVRILNDELEKFNDFYVDKEEEFVIRFQELKERIENVKEKSIKGEVFTSECEFSEEVMDIRRDFVAMHGEMVLLKNYSSLNFAGLVKILKKYDKRTGGLLRLPFTRLALDQPFFTTEPLTRLVHDCEANLELLFPLEAEVIEYSPTLRAQKISRQESVTAGTSSLETMDIYRSTLAAMRTIQGLRKASSTHNPFSLSTLLFRNQDDDNSMGALTSASDCSVNSQNDDDLP